MMFTQKTFKAIKLMSFVVVATISNGHAQTIVAPHNPDVILAPSLKTGYMNNALIDYSPNCPGGAGACGINQFSAVVVDSDSIIYNNPFTLYINDGINPVQSYNINGLRPDVVIANSTTNPGDYIVGVTYFIKNTCSSNIAGDIYLNVYEFSNVGGTGGPILVGGSPHTYLISNGKHTTRVFSHIDIVAQSSHPFLGGQPTCDKFAISFTDTSQYLPTSCGFPAGTPNPQLGLNIYWASFSSPGSGTVKIDPYTANHIPWYKNADIAAVERYNTNTSSYYNEAIYTYVDKYSHLFKNEWQEGTPAPATPPVTLDSNIAPEFPRIDAIDNYAINDPSGGNAYYVVTASTLSSPFKIYEYNNIASGPVLISGFGHPDYLPQVTNGLNRTYTIGYYTHDGVDEMLTKDISWTTGLPVSSNYFRVNLNPILYTGRSIITCLNATCNTNMSLSYNQYLMPFWTNKSALLYKTEMAITAFKSTGVATVSKTDTWSLVPNPASNYVILSTTSNNLTGYNYTISDMTGRILIKDALNSSNERINISKLASGLYLLNINNNTNSVKAIKMLKN